MARVETNDDDNYDADDDADDDGDDDVKDMHGRCAQGMGRSVTRETDGDRLSNTTQHTLTVFHRAFLTVFHQAFLTVFHRALSNSISSSLS